MGTVFRETFDDGPGGWIQVISNGPQGAQPHERGPSSIISRSPWWIDYNHAPPGAGYMHLLFCLHTDAKYFHGPYATAGGGTNQFIDGNYPTDFTNATLKIKLRGEVEMRGAQIVFLMQSKVGQHIIGQLLVGQPLEITPEWKEHTLHLTPDESQWKCLGVRHDRGETYGWGSAADVLRDLNVDFFLVMYDVDVVPAEPIADMHKLKAGEEYAVDRSKLPSGFVEMDEFVVEYAN